MAPTGFLETMAQADLDALVAAVGSGYRPGTLDGLTASDPAWHAALGRAEAEVGTLYEALREADATLARWRQAVAELYGLWTRVREASADADSSALELEEVA